MTCPKSQDDETRAISLMLFLSAVTNKDECIKRIVYEFQQSRYLPWTSTPPTQPGWYWIQPRNRRKFPVIIRLFYLMTEKELWAEAMGGKKVPVEDYEEAFLWAGPIEPPEDKFDGLMA